MSKKKRLKHINKITCLIHKLDKSNFPKINICSLHINQYSTDLVIRSSHTAIAISLISTNIFSIKYKRKQSLQINPHIQTEQIHSFFSHFHWKNWKLEKLRCMCVMLCDFGDRGNRAHMRINIFIPSIVFFCILFYLFGSD